MSFENSFQDPILPSNHMLVSLFGQRDLADRLSLVRWTDRIHSCYIHCGRNGRYRSPCSTQSDGSSWMDGPFVNLSPLHSLRLLWSQIRWMLDDAQRDESCLLRRRQSISLSSDRDGRCWTYWKVRRTTLLPPPSPDRSTELIFLSLSFDRYVLIFVIYFQLLGARCIQRWCHER